MAQDYKKYKVVKHDFDTNIRVAGYQFCMRCGLIALNNFASRRACSMSCTGREDD